MSTTEAEAGTDKQFEIHDDLTAAGKWAAAITAFKYRPDRGYIAAPSELTGTVTFLEIAGGTYALTAAHVVDYFKREHGCDGCYVPANCGMPILGPFIVPPKEVAAHKAPDIAMCPVSRELLQALGKEAFQVTQENGLPGTITHGYAVGFPTGRKLDKVDQDGTRLATQCVHALAEFRADSVDQIRFMSQLGRALPPDTRLSGMSGGPVFWSDELGYGIAGFVIEAIDTGVEVSIYGDKIVNFNAHKADYETLLSWASYVDRQYDKAMSKD